MFVLVCFDLIVTTLRINRLVYLIDGAIKRIRRAHTSVGCGGLGISTASVGPVVVR